VVPAVSKTRALRRCRPQNLVRIGAYEPVLRPVWLGQRSCRAAATPSSIRAAIQSRARRVSHAGHHEHRVGKLRHWCTDRFRRCERHRPRITADRACRLNGELCCHAQLSEQADLFASGSVSGSRAFGPVLSSYILRYADLRLRNDVAKPRALRNPPGLRRTRAHDTSRNWRARSAGDFGRLGDLAQWKQLRRSTRDGMWARQLRVRSLPLAGTVERWNGGTVERQLLSD
jgi:hypothetical protein